ncbi:MAG: 1,4-alpha-glucan branching protein GlgB [Firmicutes bacterium]|nr:1,4-alpha-glucan branching protein GlgB [Bacillota bacterium]
MDQKKMTAFFEGRELEAYNIFGAHVLKKGEGVEFTVYAPNAQAIAVVGDFNEWDGKKDPMKKDDQGIWSCIVKEAKVGDAYKYRVTQSTGKIVDKADPYAFYSELRPKTNSIIVSREYNSWSDDEWMKTRTKCYDKALNIYEMHVGSWKKDEDVEFVTYAEIEKELIEHCKKHNFTHVELMPLGEYPFDGSWGYQCTGYFSSTSRYGTNEELKHFVNNLHAAGIGVIMDFVPVHFVKDEYALAYWDGTPLYEYSRDEDAHSEWGTYNFDLWREEVRSFLMSAANFWLEEYHFDGLRMDAISNAIYWKGDKNRGANEGALNFMRRMNHLLNKKHNGSVMLIAEDSSDFQGVTKPEFDGGLGFDYKWDLGWMNDTLAYLKLDPIYRQWHHNKITFSMAYFYTERFVCPFSHDEVVHGKATIVDKMWGSYEDKFSQARALYTYMYAHPGKKLNFMGNEIGMLREWDEKKSCDWFLLDYPMHDSFEKYLADLQAIYAGSDAFWRGDCKAGIDFEWIDADNNQKNMFSFIRKGTDKDYVIVLNFSTNGYEHEQFGVCSKGMYKEVLNSQWDKYNGTWINPTPQSCQAVRLPRNNKEYMIEIAVPALGATIFEVEK